jgi:DeoR/GlpR family transcriptional regulator of sugar metabolism
MMQRARQAIVLADHTKLGHIALYRIAPVTAMHRLINDSAAPPELVRELEQLGVAVQCV